MQLPSPSFELDSRYSFAPSRLGSLGARPADVQGFRDELARRSEVPEGRSEPERAGSTDEGPEPREPETAARRTGTRADSDRANENGPEPDERAVPPEKQEPVRETAAEKAADFEAFEEVPTAAPAPIPDANPLLSDQPGLGGVPSEVLGQAGQRGVEPGAGATNGGSAGSNAGSAAGLRGDSTASGASAGLGAAAGANQAGASAGTDGAPLGGTAGQAGSQASNKTLAGALGPLAGAAGQVPGAAEASAGPGSATANAAEPNGSPSAAASSAAAAGRPEAASRPQRASAASAGEEGPGGRVPGSGSAPLESGVGARGEGVRPVAAPAPGVQGAPGGPAGAAAGTGAPSGQPGAGLGLAAGVVAGAEVAPVEGAASASLGAVAGAASTGAATPEAGTPVGGAEGAVAAGAQRGAEGASLAAGSGAAGAPDLGAARGTNPALAAHEAARPLPPEEAARLVHQVRVHVAKGLNQATLHLVPASLGRMAIRLSVRGGRVVGSIRVESAETLKTLEKHLPELRATFEQAGLEADGIEIEMGFNEQAGSGREERSVPASFTDYVPHPSTGSATDAADGQDAAPAARPLRSSTGVDTFA